jgi:uncharacterized protein (TIGR02646 family)
MAEINKTYQFTDEESLLVYVLMNDDMFTFRDWADPALEIIRRPIRNFYRNQQKGICSYCRQNVSLQSVNNCHIEHIAPKSLYRAFIFEAKNLCVICADCNEIKREQESLSQTIDTVNSGKIRKQYPRSSNSFRLVHPHFDLYDDHIEIIGSNFYVDKSKKGHFTIGACRLNRKLYKFGWAKEIVDESKVVGIMNQFLKEKNVIKKASLLNTLRQQIISI